MVGIIWNRKMTEEMLDANKLPLTHKITAVCAAYLDKRGFKPIETEVCIERGWIADLASFVYPSWTERSLIGIPCADKKRRVYTAIVEVKITKGDYKSDLFRKFKAEKLPAHICYLAYPKGMLKDSELPERWMGLEIKTDGSKMLRRKSKFVTINEQTAEQIIDTIACVAIRRAHRTRYRELRDAMRMYNAEQRESQIRYKATSLLEGLIVWLTGDGFGHEKDLHDILICYGAIRKKTKITESLAKKMQALTEIRAKIIGE